MKAACQVQPSFLMGERELPKHCSMFIYTHKIKMSISAPLPRNYCLLRIKTAYLCAFLRGSPCSHVWPCISHTYLISLQLQSISMSVPFMFCSCKLGVVLIEVGGPVLTGFCGLTGFFSFLNVFHFL